MQVCIMTWQVRLSVSPSYCPRALNPSCRHYTSLEQRISGKDYNNIIYIHTKYRKISYYRSGYLSACLLLHHREAKHPPQISFSVHPPAWEPPWNRNSRTQLFHHLQQHGFANSEYRVYFRKSYPSKEKTLKDMLAFLGIKVMLNKIQRLLFAEKLTMSGSLKNPFLLSG